MRIVPCSPTAINNGTAESFISATSSVGEAVAVRAGAGVTVAVGVGVGVAVAAGGAVGVGVGAVSYTHLTLPTKRIV